MDDKNKLEDLIAELDEDIYLLREELADKEWKRKTLATKYLEMYYQ